MRLLLAAALLALASAAQAQGLVEEFPGGIEKPATWRERVPFRPYQPVPGVNMPPRVQTAPTTFSSQTVIYGGGGGYRGGYGAGYFPRGNGFPGGQREYRGGWLMPHDFNISGGPVVRDRQGFRVYGGGYRGRRW